MRDSLILLQRAFGLVWQTSRPLTISLLALTVFAGALPAAIAWVGGQIVDAVVAATTAASSASSSLSTALSGEGARRVLEWVAIEAGLVALLAALQRGLGFCQSLLRARLGERSCAVRPPGRPCRSNRRRRARPCHCSSW